MANPAALQTVSIQKESTAGTYNAPTTATYGFLPAATCEPKAVEPRAEDMGTRGTMRAQLFGAWQTTAHWEITVKGDIWAASFGHLLMALFGTDTVGGSGTSTTHTFSIADTTYPGVASYSLFHFDNANSTNGWGYVGARLKSLSIEVEKDKLATYTAVFLAPSRASQAKPTCVIEPTTTGFGPISGHKLALTVGGSPHLEFEKWSIEWDRGTEVRQTFNALRTPNVDAVTVAPPTGTFSATAFYDDQTDYDRFASASESTIVMALGTTTPLLTVTMTAPDWREASVSAGGLDDIMRLDIEGVMKYSAVDSGICQCVLTNAKTTTGY